MTRRLALAGTVAALAATVFLLGGALSPAEEAQPAPLASSNAVAEQSLEGFRVGDTPALVRRLQAVLRSRPDDIDSLSALGFAYLQRARETGDPGYYPKAEAALRRTLTLRPGNALATSGLGSLALSRHRFREALRLGRRARALAPKTAANWGIVGDALVELGRHKEAFRAFDAMVRLDPDLPSYARISYARELLGRPGAAVRPMQAAVDASGFEPEPYAWTKVQLGKLFWSMGKTEAAAREYRGALTFFPGYVYALDALAQSEAAQGRYGRAVRLAKRAAEAMPLPQMITTLADTYWASGQRRLARQQYGVMDAIARLLKANGVRADLDLALFDVDHGIRLPRALAAARRAHRERPSLDGDDVLAWALARNDKCGEALHYSKRSLRLGTRDALKFFHRGMIERCLGRESNSRAWFSKALRQNPHFSLRWAPVARRYAR